MSRTQVSCMLFNKVKKKISYCLGIWDVYRTCGTLLSARFGPSDHPDFDKYEYVEGYGVGIEPNSVKYNIRLNKL